MLTIKTMVMFQNNGEYMFKDINNVMTIFNFDSVKIFTKVYRGELKQKIIEYIKENYKQNFLYNVSFVKNNLETKWNDGFINVIDSLTNKKLIELPFRYADVLQYKNKNKSNDYYYLHKIFDGDPIML